MKFFFFLCLIISSAAHGAADSYWERLLHWQKPLLGSEKSEASSPDFFLSPNGKFNAEDELQADVAAFSDLTHVGIGPLKQHPQCAFPERFRYLKEKLHLRVRSLPCPEFQKWKSGFNPKSVTLVYAAPFFGSPASLFGHTFLRIDSKPRLDHSEKNDLLDYGISYEADPGANPGLGFAVKGLLGFFHGSFLQQSYYLKINNYVNMESRDLWEYELNLTPPEIDRMLNHIWEMGITYFNYFFFNKNCSYELLTLLEVAKPSWDLRSHFRVMTIPSDTIRILSREVNGIRSSRMRPALLEIIKWRISQMSPNEVADFFNLRDDYSKLSGTESIKLLDTLLDWDKLRVMHELKAIYDPEHNVDKRLLVARARAYSRETNGSPDIVSQMSAKTVPPEYGHGSSKISLDGGIENGSSLFGIQFRPVFQDILDPDEGYLPHSSLVLAQTKISLVNSQIRLDDFTFAEVTNLVAVSRLKPKLSWKIGGSLFHPEDIGCNNCLGGEFAGGVGLGIDLLSRQSLFFYSLLKQQAQISNGFQSLYNGIFREGLSLESGLLAKINSKSKIFANYEPYLLSGFSGDALHQFEKLTSTLTWAFLPFEARLTVEFIFSPVQNYSKEYLTISKYF